jgi:hypothetical protein
MRGKCTRCVYLVFRSLNATLKPYYALHLGNPASRADNHDDDAAFENLRDWGVQRTAEAAVKAAAAEDKAAKKDGKGRKKRVTKPRVVEAAVHNPAAPMAARGRKPRVSRQVAQVFDASEGDDEQDEGEEEHEEEEKFECVDEDSSEDEETHDAEEEAVASEDIDKDMEEVEDVIKGSLILLLDNPYDPSCTGARINELILEFGLAKVLVAGNTGSPSLEVQYLTTAKGNVNGKWRPARNGSSRPWTGTVEKESIISYHMKLNKNLEISTASRRIIVNSPPLDALYIIKSLKLIRTEKGESEAKERKDALLVE